MEDAVKSVSLLMPPFFLILFNLWRYKVYFQRILGIEIKFFIFIFSIGMNVEVCK